METAPAKKHILIIDDDKDLRYSLRRVLSVGDYEITEAGSGEEAIEIVKKTHPAVILLDNRMEGMSGIETLQHLRDIQPDCLVIFMTAFGTTQTTIEAMKFGALDYVMKPFDPPKILGLVAKAFDTFQARSTVHGDYKPLLNSADYAEGLVGNSEAMQAVIKTVGQVAASDATVLITGESGTGKELVARCLHTHSLRTRERFMAVNCAAIPENLIESELFGHEKGAFTGAISQKAGCFELCDRGTIFLDEIGDMALATQTKILRVIQQGEIQRVGGEKTIRVNVRVIAATNKDLEKMVAAKLFRGDLYYRLNVVRLRLPPLRERMEDIPFLVDFMFQRLAAERKSTVRRISDEALTVLMNYDWPGNVRELENVIHRASLVTRNDAVLPNDLPPEIIGKSRQPGGTVPANKPATATATPTAPEAVDAPEDTPGSAEPAAAQKPSESEEVTLLLDNLYRCLREHWRLDILPRLEEELGVRALAESQGNYAKAARIVGLNRDTLRKRISAATGEETTAKSGAKS